MTYQSTEIDRIQYLVTTDVGPTLVLRKTNGVLIHVDLDSTDSVNAAVATAIGNLIAGAPGALDTLNELALAIGDDSNFAASMATALSNRLSWKGTWTATTAYAANDLVTFNGGLYRASIAFTSGGAFNKTNWVELVPQTGTYAAGLTRTTVKTADYVASAGQLVPVDTANPNANVMVTLPSAPANGSRVAVKHVAVATGKTVNVVSSGTDVFNKTGGPTSVSLTLSNQAISLQYDSGIWTVVGDDLPLSQLDSRFTSVLPTVGNFTYDGNGNILTDPDGNTYTWNADGTMNTQTKGGVTRTYNWNADGILGSVS